MRTLVVGVGNPLAGDDAIGPVVAEGLERTGRDGVTCVPFAGNGLDLLQRFAGDTPWDRVVVVDAMEGGDLEVGELARVTPPTVDPDDTSYMASHTVSILEALTLARKMGVSIPGDVRFYAVGVSETVPFREGLSPALKRRVPAIVEALAAEIADGLGDA